MRLKSFKIKAFSALTVSALLSIFSQSSAATLTWDANGATALQSDGAGVWLTANQWWDGSANVTWTSGDDAIFGNGGAGGAVTLASGTTVGSLTFNSFTGTYTIGTAGQTITLNNGITMNSGAGAATIISPITLGAAQSWTNNSSSLLTVGTDAVSNADSCSRSAAAATSPSPAPLTVRVGSRKRERARCLSPATTPTPARQLVDPEPLVRLRFHRVVSSIQVIAPASSAYRVLTPKPVSTQRKSPVSLPVRSTTKLT